MKGLFGVGKPPPPAGASLAGTPSADPLASLFASDTIVKAPGIHDAPSEAELGRWRATMQSSLFEERVVDPAPSPPPPAPPAAGHDLAPPEPPRAPPRQAPAPPAPPAPPVRAAAMFEDDEVEMAPPAGVVDEPIVQLPAAKSRSTKSTGKRRRAAAAAAQAPTEEPAAPARRRRFERGPTKSTLVALGIAAVGAIAALVIVLGPSGSSGTVLAPAVAPAAPAAPAAAAPAAAAVVAAAPAQEVEPPAETAKVAAVAKAPAAAVPEQPAPAAIAQAAAAPAKTAAGAEAAEDEAEGAPEGLLRASRQALAADDPEAAERIAREALDKAPQDHHAMEALVLALMDQDRGKDALPFARRMVQKRSRRVPYRLLLGDLLLMVGDDAAARAEWQKALALSPGDKAIKRRLGL